MFVVLRPEPFCCHRPLTGCSRDKAPTFQVGTLLPNLATRLSVASSIVAQISNDTARASRSCVVAMVRILDGAVVAALFVLSLIPKPTGGLTVDSVIFVK